MMPSAVILVHGLRTSASMWRYQVDALASLGIPVLAIDLPGHGTRMHESFTPGAALDAVGDAVTTATAQTGSAPYLVGFSLGGYLGIEWAARNPGRLSALLAASCATVPRRVVIDTWRIIARGIHALPDRGRALNDFAVRTLVPSPGADDIIAGGVALEVMDDVLRMLITLDPLDRLREIEEPVLFVNGRFDHVALQSRRFQAAARRGRLITIPRATHMVSATHPREFTSAMLRDYAATPGAARLPDAAADW